MWLSSYVIHLTDPHSKRNNYWASHHVYIATEKSRTMGTTKTNLELDVKRYS